MEAGEQAWTTRSTCEPKYDRVFSFIFERGEENIVDNTVGKNVSDEIALMKLDIPE